MFRCNECGTYLELNKPDQGDIVECDVCGIELEVENDYLLSRQIGLSEE